MHESILAPLSPTDRAAVERLRAFIFDAPRRPYSPIMTGADWLRQVAIGLRLNQPYRASHAAIMLCRMHDYRA